MKRPCNIIDAEDLSAAKEVLRTADEALLEV
jgi:hypothetical protein